MCVRVCVCARGAYVCLCVRTEAFLCLYLVSVRVSACGGVCGYLRVCLCACVCVCVFLVCSAVNLST